MRITYTSLYTGLSNHNNNVKTGSHIIHTILNFNFIALCRCLVQSNKMLEQTRILFLHCLSCIFSHLVTKTDCLKSLIVSLVTNSTQCNTRCGINHASAVSVSYRRGGRDISPKQHPFPPPPPPQKEIWLYNNYVSVS